MTIDQLEKRVSRLTIAVIAVTGMLLIVLAGAFSGMPQPIHPSSGQRLDSLTLGTLTVDQIIVKDRGVTRVRIGGQLPDAVIDGKRLTRGDIPAGVILYDAAGRERSGYVTFDHSGNVLITLDGKNAQSAFFVADTSGAAALRMWYGQDAIDLRTDDDGPRLSLIRKGSVSLQFPEVLDPEASQMCPALRELTVELSHETVLNACRSRMTKDWCKVCLGDS